MRTVIKWIIDSIFPRIEELYDIRYRYASLCYKSRLFCMASMRVNDGVYIPSKYYWEYEISKCAHEFNKNKYWFMKPIDCYSGSLDKEEE